MNRDLILQYFVEYLKEKVALTLVSLNLMESLEEATLKLVVNDGSENCNIEGRGVGIVDAGFNALLEHYGKEYKSLRTIELSDLYFQVDHSDRRDISLKSKTLMKLEFRNDSEDRTCFSEKTNSMSFTGVSVLVKAFEFYINCELLFSRLKFLIQDAENRGRGDIASKYKYALSKVVEVTSYQSVA
tara:strand:+ start:171 stop:728 length:558 start_codon:yes stop_codon:yes gene_type:complete